MYVLDHTSQPEGRLWSMSNDTTKGKGKDKRKRRKTYKQKEILRDTARFLTEHQKEKCPLVPVRGFLNIEEPQKCTAMLNSKNICV